MKLQELLSFCEENVTLFTPKGSRKRIIHARDKINKKRMISKYGEKDIKSFYVSTFREICIVLKEE